MSQTLTKPILLDETGQAIKTALQNIDETESQDWLLTYEDVHSEMDDTLAAIAGSLEAIKDVMETGEWYPDYITISMPYNSCTVGDTFASLFESPNNLKVYLYMVKEPVPTHGSTDSKMVDITNSCTFSHKLTDYMTPDNSLITATWVYGKTGKEYTAIQEIRVDVPSFQYGTIENIQKALNMHYLGLFNLHDYWSVGDARDVIISGNIYDGYGEGGTEGASAVTTRYNTLVILDKGGKELTTPINDHTECAFVLGFKNVLWYYKNSSPKEDKFYYDENYFSYQDYLDDNYPTEAYTGNWDTCTLRQLLNSNFTDAIHTGGSPDEYLTPLFKQFKNETADGYDSSTAIVSNDYFSLPAEKELFGVNTYANSTAEANLSQLDYYDSNINRKKKYGEGTDERTGIIFYLTRSIGKNSRYSNPLDAQLICGCNPSTGTLVSVAFFSTNYNGWSTIAPICVI